MRSTLILNTQCVAPPEPVQGLTPGRIVAYFPKASERDIPTPGGYPFVPAMILIPWALSGKAYTPAVNLQTFGHDGILRMRSSVIYSHVPAQGCWSFIPKDGLCEGSVYHVEVSSTGEILVPLPTESTMADSKLFAPMVQ